jgi:WD40 repeat protein/biotin carboxyl carrier protein
LWWMNSGAVHSDQTGKSAALPEPADLKSDTSAQAPQESVAGKFAPAQNNQAFYDPLVIAPCNLVPISEQDVSSQVDGIFEEVSADLGKQVRKGEVLGRLDDRQLRAQVELLQIRASSVAAERIAKAQFDEADSKVQYALKANESGLKSVPELEYKTYLYQRDRYAQEIKKAKEEREAAQKELEKAKVVLELHEIRSALAGEIVKVHKRTGEAVKQAEPLFRVADCNSLRIEGLCKVQQAGLIRVGTRALIEPEQRGEQMTELLGHTASVTAVAVSADSRLVASASEDRTVVLWSWPLGARAGAFEHPAEVTAVAIASCPASAGTAQEYALVTGCAVGHGGLCRVTANGKDAGYAGSQVGAGLSQRLLGNQQRFGNQMTKVQAPVLLSQTHEGAIRAVAFNLDRTRCATGGEDKRIGIWEVASGKHLFWLQSEDGLPAHQGTVSSLHFSRDGHLVSAGRDNVLKVWKLPSGEPSRVSAPVLVRVHPGRTGEVTQLGLSPDGRRVLVDLGEELRILDRDQGTCLGSLRNRKQGRFQGFAQFSPTGQLLLTAASNARLQLWRAPATPEETHFFRHGYTHGFHRSSLLALNVFAAESGPAGFSSLLLATSQMPLVPTVDAGLSRRLLLGNEAPQLWQLPGQEVRHFVIPGGSIVNCGAFAPDESVFFTGGTDKSVRVWAVPPVQVWNQPMEARITYVGSQVERGTDMVRIRAEMENPQDPDRRLRSGLYAVMRLFPETAGK